MNTFFKTANYIWYLWKRNGWMLNPRFYFSQYKEIVIDRPIFLLGTQGGGLTLVSRMLRRAPSVVSVTGGYRYWSGADEMHTVFGHILPAELTGTRYKVPQKNHRLYKPPRSWTYACDELLPFYRKTALDFNEKLKKNFERVIRMCIAKTATNGMVVRFTDKSQVYTVRVSLITKLLEEHDPRFVLITNNPYAACFRAALGKAVDMKHLESSLTLDKRLEICAQHWANSMRCALEDKTDSMIVVKFEDILQEPARYLKQVCSHVDIEFSKNLLPKAGDTIPFGSRFPDRWYPLKVDRVLHYIERASGREIDIIHQRCGQIALDLGYYSPSTNDLQG